MNNALIVGCGNIAGGGLRSGVETHAGAIIAEHRLALRACVDSDIKKAQTFANKYKCKSYDDLSLALDENKVDVVVICTPDSTHFSITKKVILSPGPPQVIFLEKPVCNTQDEYEELIVLAEEREVLIVVNYTRRFSSIYNKIRELICTNQFGPICRIYGTYYSGWLHNGSHLIDTLSFLLGESVEWKELNGLANSPYIGDPSLELTGFLSKSKAKVVISAIDESIYQVFEIDIWCKLARLRIESFGRKVSVEKKVINSIGENVLKAVTIDLPSDKKSEMQLAFKAICDYLSTKDIKPLKHVLIQSIQPTMESLWNGQKFI